MEACAVQLLVAWSCAHRKLARLPVSVSLPFAIGVLVGRALAWTRPRYEFCLCCFYVLTTLPTPGHLRESLASLASQFQLLHRIGLEEQASSIL